MQIVGSTNPIIAEANDFVDKMIRPFAGTFDQQGSIPRQLIDQLGDKGYLGANLPREYGGLELDPVEYGLLTEQMGKGCSSIRSFLTVHSSLVGESILRFGTPNQKEKFLPSMARGKCLAAFALSEETAGTNARAISTTYHRLKDKYVINGRKKWITMGAIANLILVVASDSDKISTFLVPSDTAGITISPMQGLMANRAAYVSEIDFNNVEIPEDNILNKEGNGFSYVVNTALDHGRYSVAWGGLAIAQEALECMIAYSKSRKQFGVGIYNFQSIKSMIADAMTKVAAGRALCMQVAELRKINHVDAVNETIIAKYFTSKIANQVASDAVQIHGGNGLHSDYPAERLFREAKVLEIIEGTSQVLQEMIADHALANYKKN